MDDDQLDLIFGALSDRSRRVMLERLRSGPRSAGDLAAGLPLTQPTVSKHLKVLETAGLIRRERDGTRIYSVLAIDPLVRAAIFVSQFEQVVDARLDRLATLLDDRAPQEGQHDED